MALQYGVNITASDMRNILEQNDKQQNGVRSWRQLFGNASLGYESQADALKSYYSDAMAQAYKSNFAQQNAIMGAGLNVGATRELVSANRQDLQSAYDTYVKNYATNLQSAASDYGSEVTAIDEALTERATNFANLYDSAYKYLSSELFGSTLTHDGTTPIYEKDGKEEKLVGYEKINKNYLTEHGLDWLTTTDADGVTSLKSWDDIKAAMVNDDGTLNEQGQLFFDQMFNARPDDFKKETGEKARTFDEWLSEENSDLRDWLASQDAFNYTFAGTNKGTANTMRGKESTDDDLSTEQQTMYNAKNGGYGDAVARVKAAVNSANQQKNMSGVSSSLNDIGNIKNKQTSWGNKDMSYNDWFDWVKQYGIDDNWLNIHGEGEQEKAVGAMKSYIETYERTMNTEINTFKSEVSALLGEQVASEFWSMYGKEVEAQLNSVNELLAPTKDKWYYSINYYDGLFLTHGATNDTTKKVYNLATKLRSSELASAISKLYINLQAFINKKHAATKSKTSGF